MYYILLSIYMPVDIAILEGKIIIIEVLAGKSIIIEVLAGKSIIEVRNLD